MKREGLKYTSEAPAPLTVHLNLWNEGLRGFVVQDDEVAVEEPLEMRLVYGPSNDRVTKSIAITMRTPGNDDELALGFLTTEGVLSRLEEVEDVIRPYFVCGRNQGNVLEVHTHPSFQLTVTGLERNFYVSSSCGVCGKASIEAVRTRIENFIDVGKPKFKVTIQQLINLPAKLREQQRLFLSTGGLHASAVFNSNLELILLREDVGRHNALDKVIGAALMNHVKLLDNALLLLSGRASFELIQKAAMVGIPIVAAIGAPSSLAISIAEETGITLVGFLKEHKFNIYTHPHRIKY